MCGAIPLFTPYVFMERNNFIIHHTSGENVSTGNGEKPHPNLATD
jgi:hypothetical protein